MTNKKYDLFMETFFKDIPKEELEKALEESRIERDSRLKRKEKSQLHCLIPDWTGNGGMVNFWINGDGTLESENYNDGEIKDLLKKFISKYDIIISPRYHNVHRY